ncbi:hypothetical protein NDU88_002083 [Pleurodeles waltl]|uniref:Uncharacterized protein n=1 Tax=Pleurodeles waltl TaxID=8319 RepID=A0AAV7TKZ2_PLEWA|nr:hypothetical protein NDU88_002083 [Pleurodeles waltl]
MVIEPGRDNNDGRAGRFRLREAERRSAGHGECTLQNAAALRSRPDRTHNTLSSDRKFRGSTNKTALRSVGLESTAGVPFGGRLPPADPTPQRFVDLRAWQPALIEGWAPASDAAFSLLQTPLKKLFERASSPRPEVTATKDLT